MPPNPEQLERVLLHLLENVAEYTPAGGKSIAGLSRNVRTHLPSSSSATIGCIPEEQSRNDLQAFTEVKDRRGRPGTPSAHWIATKMNGSLTLDSSYK